MGAVALAEDDSNQVPSILWVPECAHSLGEEAIELCRRAGLLLDPWQEFVLVHSLGRRADDKWSAFEVGLVVPRQNGKTALAVARELVGLFLLGERLIIHSAHQFDTSLEAFRLLTHLIESTPDLDQQVKKKSSAHGVEGIELRNGQRVRFRTRTKGGGRGFTSDCLILDEAMILPEMTVGALLPTLSARPNPQVWYCASAVDKQIHDEGVVLARLRERALAGGDSGLAYFEWSAPGFESPDEVTEPDATDAAVQRRSNPGYDRRISGDHIVREQRSMDPRTFAVERLGVGDWPDPREVSNRPISPDSWSELFDELSVTVGPVCFAFDVNPERTSAAVGVAGQREDGLYHAEIVKHQEGTEWVPGVLQTVMGKHENIGAAVLDLYGPAGSLVPKLEELLVPLRSVNSTEHAAACGLIYDLVMQQRLRHLGSRELREAIAGAVKRPLTDRWAWSRVNSTIDISPLVAITLALWGLIAIEDKKPTVWNLGDILKAKAAREREREAEEAATPLEPDPDSERNRPDFVSLEDAPPQPGMFGP